MTDLKGKTVVITGGNSGIGKETAVALAGMGADVAITARNPEKGAAALADIVARSGKDRVQVVPLDLASLTSVRACAADLAERFEHIDVLINNAGGTLSKRQITEDGFEMTFGVNHLGHFLLTNLLLGSLENTGSARVITVASGAHQGARKGLDFDDLHREQGRYRGFWVYCRSKLANVLFSNELARRLAGTGVTSNAMHPGWVGTNFGREGDTSWLGPLTAISRPFAMSPKKGADTVVYLASSPEVQDVTGQYFYKRKLSKTSARGGDAAAASQLWETSEQMVGLAKPPV
ncbi:MAG: dehydrogenase, short-chain alcohol dehydrogenase like [Actinomycetia bacterium]|nr:dehydrogenase, short-chain alcohol dehydrogenase like [Actinomycetes bacterium]